MLKENKKNIFYIKNNIRSLHKKRIMKSLNESKYVILRGLFHKLEIKKILKNVKKKFKHKNDKIRPKGKYDLIKSNYPLFIGPYLFEKVDGIKTYWLKVINYKYFTNCDNSGA